MRLELFPLTSGEEANAWGWFKTNSMRHVLSNEVVKRILTIHDELETAAPEKISALQSEVKALRFLHGLVHRHTQPK